MESFSLQMDKKGSIISVVVKTTIEIIEPI